MNVLQSKFLFINYKLKYLARPKRGLWCACLCNPFAVFLWSLIKCCVKLWQGTEPHQLLCHSLHMKLQKESPLITFFCWNVFQFSYVCLASIVVIYTDLDKQSYKVWYVIVFVPYVYIYSRTVSNRNLFWGQGGL